MKPFDLMEALTDMDDDVLRRAEAAPLRPPRRVHSWLRYVTAACLAMAVLMVSLLSVDVIAGDNLIQWTVRHRDNEVSYRFRSGGAPQEPIPEYAPTWLPEGYVLERDSKDEFPQDIHESRYLIYGNPDDPQDCIWFSYYYVRKGYETGFSFDGSGGYRERTVDINGITADLYLYRDGPAGGVLIWIDRERSIVFTVRFFDDDTSVGEKVARSVQLVEPTE